MMQRVRRAFSLVEMIVVLLIMGIGMAMFFSTLHINWVAYDSELIRLDLQQQADQISSLLAADVRGGEANFTVPNSQQVNISYPSDLILDPVSYSISANGELTRTEGSTSTTLSNNVDTVNSSFSIDSINCLVIDMRLAQNSLGQEVNLSVSDKFFPRN